MNIPHDDKENMFRSEKHMNKKAMQGPRKSITPNNTQQIRKLDKTLRVAAIGDFIQQLTEGIDGNNISQIAANVDQMHQTRCDQITEKSILQLEQRILKKIEQLKAVNLTQTDKSKLLQNILQDHILYDKLRRERSNKGNLKSKVQQTLQNKDNDWIAKLLKKLGGLSHQDSFHRRGSHTQSNNDLLSRSMLSDSNLRQKRGKRMSQHFKKIQLQTQPKNVQQDELQVEYKHSFIKKQKKLQQQQLNNQTYRQLSDKINYLTEELRQQSNIIKQLLLERRSYQIIDHPKQYRQSKLLKKTVVFDEQQMGKVDSQCGSRISIDMPQTPENSAPIYLQRSNNNSTKNTRSHHNLVARSPQAININIRILPY